MNLKPVHLKLETEEVQRIVQIALDADKQGALDLVQTVLVKKVEIALQRH